jgi:Skp family chaperone for outer membrane proteins
MSSSKALNSLKTASLASLALKTAGVIILLAALFDIIILPFPFQPLDRQWQINFITLAVDRGIVPLVGLALLLVGYWVDAVSGLRSDRPSRKSLGFWALILSCLLGLFFVLAFPLHLNNVRLNHQQAVERIGQESSQAETQLDQRLQAEVGQQRQQIEQLLANPEQLDQALASGQIPEQQAAVLRQFREDPNKLNQFIDQRVGELRQQFQTEIGTRREQALKTARLDAIKSGLRVSVSSLLLAIGFITIGWIGLRDWGTATSGRTVD